MATQLNLPMERDLFEAICSIPSLRRAFHDVRRNKGSAGVDGKTVQDFGSSKGTDSSWDAVLSE